MNGNDVLKEPVSPSRELKNKQKYPFYITKDGVKWLLTASRVVMETLCVWPDTQNKTAYFVVNLFCIISFGFIVVAEMAFILDKNTDVGSAVDGMTAFMSSVEAMGRRILGMLLAKRFSKMLSTMYYYFWPSNIAGKALHHELVKGSRFVAGALAIEACASLSWGFQSCLVPLYYHRMPLSSKFGVKYKYMESPFYEILYVWEAFMAIDLTANVPAFELFFFSLIWNCVAQFKLLKKFLEVEFPKTLKDTERAPPGARSKALDLILLVVQRHNNLINTCKELEGMLAIFILIVYVGTIGTICLSSFLMTVVQNHIAKAIPYFVGHLVQIFVYCYVGNELILASTELSNAVAQCGWHLGVYDRNLEKSLILLMVRSQRAVDISVGGFGVLSLASYMKLLQFCFSVYTVLSSTVRINKQN